MYPLVTLTFIVMAYIVMAYMVMPYMVMPYIVLVTLTRCAHAFGSAAVACMLWHAWSLTMKPSATSRASSSHPGGTRSDRGRSHAAAIPEAVRLIGKPPGSVILW